MKDFKDYFSKQSKEYATFRPTYPIELFKYLVSLSPKHDLAWDCGTGNGQTALNLAAYFKATYATDPSKDQLKNAPTHPKINYKVEKAENCGLSENSVDLVTVSQALHWFNFTEFYIEVKRVLKPDGIIAAWTYGLPRISPEIDQIIDYYHDSVLDGYWREGNQLVAEEYKTIPFPFEEIYSPDFKIQKNIELNELIGLLKTWSATQRYIDQNAADPVDEIEQDLGKLWKNKKETKASTWRIVLKAGKVSQ